MPGNKNVYRLYSTEGYALIDLMQKDSEPAPEVGQKILCRHPFQESKRAYVNPSRIEPLYKVFSNISIYINSSSLEKFTNKFVQILSKKYSFFLKIYWQNGIICQTLPTLEEIREKVQSSLRSLRNDHKRTLNPTPYKVSVSDGLYSFIHLLWLENAPIGELS